MVSFRALTGAVVATLAVLPGIVSAQLICASVQVNIPVGFGLNVNLFGAPTCACTQNGQLTQGSKDLVTTRIGILGSLLGTVSAGTVNNLLLSAILGSGSQTSSCGSGAAVNQRRSLPKRCPTGQRACAISTAPSLANVFDCIDTTSDIESCGGCAYPARGEVAGQDCTSLPFVDVVECVAGGCLISSCQRGYALSSNGTCIPSLSKAALVYQS